MTGLRQVIRVPLDLRAWMFWVLTLFCITVSTPAQSSSQISEQHIRVDVNLATLKFTVRETQGKLINNLNRDHFRVLEGGVPQEIAFFEPPRNTSGEMGPLRLAFLIDMSGSTLATRAEELTSAGTFLENVHDFTEVGVFGFTHELIPLQNFTSNRSLAQKALSKAREHLGRTAIYDSLSELILRMKSRPTRTDRNVIIIISDGLDDAYRMAPQSISLALSNNVVIYTVLVPSAAQLYLAPTAPVSQSTLSSTLPSDEREAKAKSFASLSLRTDGEHFSGFETILNFDQVMAQINDDVFGNLYSIGYYTNEPYRDRAERDIRVEINYPNASIPARFESLPEQLSAKMEFIAALFDNEAMARLPKSLQPTFHEIGADLDLLSPQRQGGQIGLPFRIKINPLRLRRNEKGSVQTHFGVIALLLDQEGNEVVRLRELFRVNLDVKELRAGRGIIYNNKLFAPPGTYSLRLALLEIATWKMTVFEKVVRIREP